MKIIKSLIISIITILFATLANADSLYTNSLGMTSGSIGGDSVSLYTNSLGMTSGSIGGESRILLIQTHLEWRQELLVVNLFHATQTHLEWLTAINILEGPSNRTPLNKILFYFLSSAWAAANLAIGTLYGEQET